MLELDVSKLPLPCLDDDDRIVGVSHCGDAAPEALRVMPCRLGACCNDQTGECWDDVIVAACPHEVGWRWIENVKCADLLPACGTGACCHEDTGLCEDGRYEEDCQLADDRWEQGVTCDEMDPPCSAGACCDDSICECEDGVEEQDCPSPKRWAQGVTCAGLDPPCGIGACCDDDGGECINWQYATECAAYAFEEPRWVPCVECHELDPSCGRGACCNAYAWICEDDVHESDCPDAFQFRAGQRCEDINCEPPEPCGPCDYDSNFNTPRSWTLRFYDVNCCSGCHGGGPGHETDSYEYRDWDSVCSYAEVEAYADDPYYPCSWCSDWQHPRFWAHWGDSTSCSLPGSILESRWVSFRACVSVRGSEDYCIYRISFFSGGGWFYHESTVVGQGPCCLFGAWHGPFENQKSETAYCQGDWENPIEWSGTAWIRANQ